jgi:hypothetical protein
MDGGRRRGAQTAQQRPDHSARCRIKRAGVGQSGAWISHVQAIQSNETRPCETVGLLPEDRPVSARAPKNRAGWRGL